MITILFIASCGRPNPAYLDPSSTGGAGDDAAVTTADDMALPPSTDDLNGPRLAIASPCGGNAAGFVSSGQPFIVSLKIVDGANQVIDTDVPVTVALESADHPTTFTGGGTVDATHGLVDFASLTLDHWGKGVLIATAPGVASLELPFTVHAVQPAFLTQPSDTVATQVMSPSVRVGAADVTGSIDEGYGTFSLGLTGCGVPPSTNIATVATVGGVATFDGLKIDRACDSYQLQLNTATGYTLAMPPLLTNTFAVKKGPPVQLSMSTPRFATRNVPFTVTVSITDAGGNVIEVAPTMVTLSLTGATLTGTTTGTTSGGTATFANLSVGPAGTFTLTATATGFPDATVSLRVSAWEQRTSQGVSGLAVAIDDPNTVYGWTSQHVLVSHNGAETWSALRDWPSVGPVVPDPNDAKTLWMITPNGGSIERSTDAGATWQFAGANNMEVSELAVGRGSPTTLVVPGGIESVSGPTPTVWISHDSGATWTTGGPALGATDVYQAVAINPADDAIYISAGHYTSGLPAGFLARSTDGGATWTTLPGVGCVFHLAFDPFAPTTIFASSCVNELLGRSTDNGATWSWTTLQLGGIVAMNPLLQGHFLDGNTGTGEVMLSTDDGATWTTSLGLVENQLGQLNAPNVVFAPSDGTIAYAAGGVVFRSTTGGE